MKLDKWKIVWGALLISLSIVFYFIHFLIFRDPHHLFIFLVGDVAFVFTEVLLVTMIIHELLTYRENKEKMYKLNMVIGAFFSDVGTDLLRIFSDFDHNIEGVRDEFMTCQAWSDSKYTQASETCKEYHYDIDCRRGDLKKLKDFLVKKRAFMLSLIQNPSLLEHDTFSDLLWMIFHLIEELVHREDLDDLSDADYEHIAIDIKRAYSLLSAEWLVYMKHLKNDYPYLYSLAVRINPFNPDASAEIKEG
ncbi:MAG: hypothetical protein JW743_04530 [Deltaproteobacteria bacterium]|nr:hypothetical protein [Deltaproteobacteria bacterium]MBN2845103.1 hypothetical protein [Deltaproteobacteria bacterium]